MNTKNAIKNVADVPNKFNKSGGEVSGSISPATHKTLNLGSNSKYFNNIHALNLISCDPDNTSYNGSLYYTTTQYFQSGAWIIDSHRGKLEVGDTGTSIYGTANNGLLYNDYEVYHKGNKPTASEIGALSSNGTAIAANKLATARTIFLTGSVTGSVSFDGSSNVTLNTATNHTHSYLPIGGGNVTGYITFDNALGIRGKETGGTIRTLLTLNNSNKVNAGSFLNPFVICSNETPVYSPSAVTSYKLYHEGNKPTATAIGAIPSSKITISKTAPSNPSTGDLWISW